MKIKTIKSIITKKVDDWLESIEDDHVRQAADRDTIVTGGCIASMLLRERVNDFDVYFRTRETALAVAKYYVNQFKKNPPTKLADGEEAVNIRVDDSDDDRIKITVKSAGVASEEGAEDYQFFEQLDEAQAHEAGEYVERALKLEEDPAQDEKPPYRPVFLSSNAITLSNRIQLVIRFYGEPDEIHENYDFVHCTNHWTRSGGLVLRQEALESLLERDLKYIGSLYPVCSVIRSRKFVQRGWTITAGQYLKMCFQISQLDLQNVNVLEEQLVGVDVAYFLEVIDKLRAESPEKVDYAYLMEIIDRMF